MVLEKEIGDILLENNWTLSIAESCTGGYLSHRITNIPGCSEYFIGSYIAYDEKMKIINLGVNEELLSKFGIYSKEVALDMAEKIRNKTNASFSLSTTGIAPPGDINSIEKVGLVYIGFSSKKSNKSIKLQLNCK